MLRVALADGRGTRTEPVMAALANHHASRPPGHIAPRAVWEVTPAAPPGGAGGGG